MILADKIIRLRKKNGWSQEELAEKVNVSRQAVAKWEGAQTVPSLDKILQLGDLFGVTTDYLLKDDIEDEEFTDVSSDSNVKHVTLASANEFLEWRKSASIRIAAATFLCIISVIPLFLLENAVGLCILLAIVAVASGIFIHCGFKNTPYDFLDKDIFETEYGVNGMVLERQKNFRNTYIKFNIIGTVICIISAMPLLISSFSEDEFLEILMLSITMLIAGIGVIFFIVAGVRQASMQKLLQEGEFSPKEKRKSHVKESIGTIYWLLVTSIYLGCSFATSNWRTSWIILPVAGVLFAVVMIICNLIIDRKEK